MKVVFSFFLTVTVLIYHPMAFSDTVTKTEKTGELIFSAPPRETPSVGMKRYGPIASYLSKVIGRKVVYKYPKTWGAYRTEMLQGTYDIVFDGPHFNSYRAERMHHNILAKIPIEHQFVVIVNQANKRFNTVTEMAGHTFCSHAPPNLGTLALLNHFKNPARQPAIVNTKGWKKIYLGVVSGRCEGGILPIANLYKYDPNVRFVRIIYKEKTIPNQAFSAGPRLSKQEQERVAEALVSNKSNIATSELRSAYRVGDHFVRAKNKEYDGISEYLRNEWGYYK